VCVCVCVCVHRLALDFSTCDENKVVLENLLVASDYRSCFVDHRKTVSRDDGETGKRAEVSITPYHDGFKTFL